MNDRIKKVFDIIGIQPNEPFFFRYGTDRNSYYIDEVLNIKSCKDESISEKYTIKDFLINLYSIETKNSIKAKIEIFFKFLVEIYDFHYLAKDGDGEINAYTVKPKKIVGPEEWCPFTPFTSKEIENKLIPQYLIDHISKLVSWEDDEPLDMREPDIWQRLV